MKNKNGFTLIELLVVISIIAMLSSIMLAGMNTARMKARDSRRIQDLKQIQNALEMYRNDHEGKYPSSRQICSAPGCNSTNSTDWLSLSTTLSKYISTLPVDPINNSTSPWSPEHYSYNYRSCESLNCYDLITQLEDKNSPYRCEIKNYFYFTVNKFWLDKNLYPEATQLYSSQ